MWKALLATDCDGSLTDGTVLYLDDGTRGRRFSVVDGHAFLMLKNSNILPLIVSGEHDQNIKSRAKKLRVDFLSSPCKTDAIAKYIMASGLSPGIPLIVFGDDVNDLGLMKSAHFVGCPQNAQKKIREYVTLRHNEGTGYVCENKGGENAFREFCEVVLAQS